MTQLPEEPSVLALILQQVGVPLVCLIAVGMTDPMHGDFARSVAGQMAEALWGLIGALVFGFIIGLLVSRFTPIAASTGKWIWIIPTLLCLWAFLDESLRHSSVAALQMLFFPGPDGEQWWVFGLLTVPTVSTSAYSLTVGWRAHAARRRVTDARY